ncbi:glycoside hydrolase family 88 protein [Mucilaginibacter paludis]|uniref:Glycosyl hydrolase family 88 n=1 Tax=Mucilaginibacter paludis DSM 18603 TaxID=714943 RepID=H1YFM5_9SPHI|nr:glycoside hydrolase family 88 protein [Mucilaginibacter paludis]EHQ24427.1 glycosyl hydrolase family 88 [Mucilaginibacter paludis DSM 18603]
MKNKYICLCLMLLICRLTVSAQNTDVAKGFAIAEKQTELLLKETASARNNPATKANMVSPRTETHTGELVLIPSKDWVSGFFPGELWYLYEYSNDKKWLEEAKTYTANIEPEKMDRTSHDVGFKVYCSFGNGYRLTHDEHYKEVIIQAAKTLSTRFNPVVGCIKSWDGRKEWKYPVIIDNMLNLELLFNATRFSGDSSFYKIAVSHANTTLKNHFRADYSCYHVVDYDPETGKVLHKQTHQGYSDESSWARGQGWALYGFTMCYRETKNKAYLHQAEKVARFILDNPNLPKDMVPYWDLNAPAIPDEPRDASAAAVMASALYELSTFSPNGKLYRAKADAIIKTLTSKYTSKIGEHRGFILLHSTGHKPANSEIDVPISYADYYYLEALLRQKHIKERGKI